MSENSAATALAELGDAYWQTLLRHHPVYASALGYREFDHLLPDGGAESRATLFKTLRGLKASADGLRADALSPSDQVTLEVLRATLDVECAGEEFLSERWAVNPLFGTHVMLTELSTRQPTSNAAELGRLLDRYTGAPRLLAQERAWLDEGVRHGQTAFHVAVERSIGQLDRLLDIPPERSSFIPVAYRHEELAPADAARIAPLLDAVRGAIYPALHDHRNYLRDQYLPRARRTPGLASMPGGAEYYAYTILHYTGLAHRPEEVHQRGLDELARIHREMREVAVEVGGSGDVRAMADTLAARPDQRPTRREDILERNQTLVARAWEALPAWFSTLPPEPCEVRLIEAFRESDSPAGYYDRAPSDRSRPAIYYVNGHEPQDRAYFNMEALAFHEAVPGHHLQISLAQTLRGLPEFRRHLGNTAFIEGWALYSERLADEMGLYSDACARFGMLGFQAWRACRLVIDTGLHALGWERDRAIEFLLSNTTMGRSEAVIEVDRYIAMPGQALSYMLGRMELDALRARAQAALGDRFDIKEFHARVLMNGALPLMSLERLIDRWLDEPR